MDLTSKKTLVLGASANPARYSFLAVNKLRSFNHPVVGIGRKNVVVADVTVQDKTTPIPNLDTVTIYLNAENQKSYYDFIIEQHPRRVIFNPGAENPAFSEVLQKKGIATMNACTLVLLGTGQY